MMMMWLDRRLWLVVEMMVAVVVVAVDALVRVVSAVERFDARLSPTYRDESAMVLTKLERHQEGVDDMAVAETRLHCRG